jgi:hypothetical protein
VVNWWFFWELGGSINAGAVMVIGAAKDFSAALTLLRLNREIFMVVYVKMGIIAIF